MQRTRCLFCRHALRPARQIRTYSSAAPEEPVLTPATVKRSPDTPRSSVLGGVKLNNIQYLKNRPDPIALPDEDYPAWLWRVLGDPTQAAESSEDLGDLYSKSKKARKAATKRAAKLAARQAGAEKKVPLEEQTLDLPFATVPVDGPATGAGTGFAKTVVAVAGVGDKGSSTVVIGEGGVQVGPDDAAKARAELKKALRKKSRAGIKERNFLSQM